MKLTTIYLDEIKIEIFNSIIGIETIKVNGEVVSSKFSFFGATHYFSLTENETVTNYMLKLGFGFNGVVFDLYKNNKPIIESPKSGCLLFFLIICSIYFVIELIGHLLFK